MAKLRFNASMNAAIAAFQFAKTPLFAKVVPADIASGGSRNSEAAFPCYIKELDPLGQLKINEEIITTITLEAAGSLTLATGA